MKRILETAAALLCVLTVFTVVSCKRPGQPGGAGTGPASATSAGDASQIVDTEAGSAGSTAADTVTEPDETEPVKPDVTDGMMIYYEDFTKYGDVEGTDAVIEALGWRILSKDADLAPSDWTASLEIKNGGLVVRNYSEDGSFKGTDGYAMVLDDGYMDRALRHGTYTLQYDVTYESAVNHKRYLNFVTEFDGESYNSFHFRIGGYGNNQIYYFEKWYTYDSLNEDDLSAAVKETGNGASTIAYKLLGRSETLSDDHKDMFSGITVTVRVIRGAERADILMKTADMADFVRISRYSDEGDAYGYEDDLEGKAVCFKTGGAVNGRIENVALWTGDGDMPADKTITYVP